MNNCIFCQIVRKQIPTKLEYKDEEIVAFNDIHPKAPIHILIVPKKHIASVTEMAEEDIPLIGKMVFVAKKIAEEKSIADKGYKLVFNVGKEGGQIVEHIHLHLLGGQKIEGMI